MSFVVKTIDEAAFIPLSASYRYDSKLDLKPTLFQYDDGYSFFHHPIYNGTKDAHFANESFFAITSSLEFSKLVDAQIDIDPSSLVLFTGLLAPNGRYITNQGNNLYATSTTLGSAEFFQIVRNTDGTHSIKQNDLYATVDLDNYMFNIVMLPKIENDTANLQKFMFYSGGSTSTFTIKTIFTVTDWAPFILTPVERFWSFYDGDGSNRVRAIGMIQDDDYVDENAYMYSATVALDNFAIGFDGKIMWVKYYNDLFQKFFNRNVNIKDYISDIVMNYMVESPYKTKVTITNYQSGFKTGNMGINMVNLKNIMTPEYDYNAKSILPLIAPTSVPFEDIYLFHDFPSLVYRGVPFYVGLTAYQYVDDEFELYPYYSDGPFNVDILSATDTDIFDLGFTPFSIQTQWINGVTRLTVTPDNGTSLTANYVLDIYDDYKHIAATTQVIGSGIPTLFGIYPTTIAYDIPFDITLSAMLLTNHGYVPFPTYDGGAITLASSGTDSGVFVFTTTGWDGGVAVLNTTAISGIYCNASYLLTAVDSMQLSAASDFITVNTSFSEVLTLATSGSYVWYLEANQIGTPATLFIGNSCACVGDVDWILDYSGCAGAYVSASKVSGTISSGSTDSIDITNLPISGGILNGNVCVSGSDGSYLCQAIQFNVANTSEWLLKSSDFSHSLPSITFGVGQWDLQIKSDDWRALPTVFGSWNNGDSEWTKYNIAKTYAYNTQTAPNPANQFPYRNYLTNDEYGNWIHNETHYRHVNHRGGLSDPAGFDTYFEKTLATGRLSCAFIGSYIPVAMKATFHVAYPTTIAQYRKPAQGGFGTWISPPTTAIKTVYYPMTSLTGVWEFGPFEEYYASFVRDVNIPTPNISAYSATDDTTANFSVMFRVSAVQFLYCDTIC